MRGWARYCCWTPRFFTERVLGPHRKTLLAATLPTLTAEPDLDDRRKALHTQLAQLQRGQTNLLRELENAQPTGDADLDTAWRTGIQARFAENVAEARTKTQQLEELTRRQQQAAPPNTGLLDTLPVTSVDVTRLPDEQQRQLYDAFHLEVRYHPPTNTVTPRVTINAETAPALADTARHITGIPAPRTPPETGTCTHHPPEQPHPAGCTECPRQDSQNIANNR